MDAVAPAFLSNRALRLVMFGGKGGAGKTTCAAATASTLAARDPEAPYLLVSTDPAHSLVYSLAASALPPNLTVTELDAQECLAEFKAAQGGKLKEIGARATFLDDDDVQQLLDLSLPGFDELIALLEIARRIEEGRYACVVVDAAPWGHTLRLLEAPEAMRRWLEALDALVSKDRYMKKLYRGVYHLDEVDEFLLGLRASVDRLQRLLRDPLGCRFVPVTLAERLSIDETLGMVADLERLKIPVTDLVVNCLHPERACSACAGARGPQLREVARVQEGLSGYLLSCLPLLPDEIRGRDRLRTLWSESARPPDVPEVPWRPSPRWARVHNAPALPPAETALLIFAGKGGVGKTTLACATALRLADEHPERHVLLFSTGPAHSLSACVGRRIGPDPVRLSSSLTAMEIDGQAELEALRRRYAGELERTLGSQPPSLDLTFDREVMERVLDLAAPGLDEVMALARAMEFLSSGTSRVVVFDAAPTGHLLRLLQMPDPIERWLKVFFGLFLKHEDLFRLSVVADRLVRLSKGLRRFRTLLEDPARTSLYAVATPTEMAYEETRDLLAACERMKLDAPVLFVNLATPESDCPLCSSRRRRESLVEARFTEAFPGLHQARVDRGGEPRGPAPLGELGRALYRPA